LTWSSIDPPTSKKQDHLDRVAPLGPGLDVEIAVFGRGADGAVEVEALPPRRRGPRRRRFSATLMLRVPSSTRVVEVAELALVPDLDRAAVAAFVLADAHALGIVAIGAEGRGAGGADPFRPALVPALLFLQPLRSVSISFSKPPSALDQLLLVLAQVLLGNRFSSRRQPAGPDCRAEDQRLYLMKGVSVAMRS
jgi:hypothetical protein